MADGRPTWNERLSKRVKPQQKDGAAHDGQEPTPENYTMLQGFEWYVPDDHKHWNRLRHALPGLKATGIDNLWIPPACKASSPSGNGYDIYDLYDLGEFDAKGSVGTKWGTKQELDALVDKAEEVGVGLYFDAVLNHKAAADHVEKCQAKEVDSNGAFSRLNEPDDSNLLLNEFQWDFANKDVPADRTREISDVVEIEGWLGFDFPARGDKYSSQKYHWHHFTGTDYDNATKKTSIYKILGENKAWSTSVDKEKGNYDYLMFADLDYSHPEVQEDVKNWGVWAAKNLKLKGFRLDAIKHYSETFLVSFVKHLDETLGEGWFFVGEFWKSNLEDLTAYLSKMEHRFCLFDAPLVYKFSSISQGDKADLRSVFDGTLVQAEPYNAVTLVMNHDTQPSQALAAPISDWFIPHAYAFILLRNAGYPCLFYGDVYGLKGGVSDDWQPPTCQGKVPDLALARKLYAYGEQDDYFDAPNCIGWVRTGTWDHPAGLAAVLSNAGADEKRMFVGEMHKGEKWTDIMEWQQQEVEIGEDGFGMFPVGPCSVGVYVKKDAEGRDRFGKFDNKIYG